MLIDTGLGWFWLNGFSGGGAARAEDAPGTPAQSHISPSILVYEDKSPWALYMYGPLNPSGLNQCQELGLRVQALGLGVVGWF